MDVVHVDDHWCDQTSPKNDHAEVHPSLGALRGLIKRYFEVQAYPSMLSFYGIFLEDHIPFHY
jgi:hypothetical protein